MSGVQTCDNCGQPAVNVPTTSSSSGERVVCASCRRAEAMADGQAAAQATASTAPAGSPQAMSDYVTRMAAAAPNARAMHLSVDRPAWVPPPLTPARFQPPRQQPPRVAPPPPPSVPREPTTTGPASSPSLSSPVVLPTASPVWATARASDSDARVVPPPPAAALDGGFTRCAQCGVRCDEDDVVPSEQDGRLLCPACAVAVGSAAAAADAKADAEEVARNRPLEEMRRRHDLTLGVIGAAAVVGVIGVPLTLYLIGTHKEPPPPLPPVPDARAAAAALPSNDGAGGKLLDLMNVAADHEAAGRHTQALERYETAIEILSARKNLTPQQVTILEAAREGAARASAADLPFTGQAPVAEAPTPSAPAPATPAPAAPPSLPPVPAPAAAAPPAPAPAPAPAAPTTAGNDPVLTDVAVVAAPPAELWPASIDGPMRVGQFELAKGNYDAAEKSFRAAMDSVARNCPSAIHGLGVAYAYRGNAHKAVETLEQASAAAGGGNRAIVYNLAVAHIDADNAMVAAKLVRDYLARPDGPLDEPLQNVLGSALAATTGDARLGVAFAQLRDFYTDYDRRLAETRKDGKQRWGMRWVDAAEAESKWKQSRLRAEDVDRLTRDAKRAEARTAKALAAVNELRATLQRNPAAVSDADAIHERWRQAKATEAKLHDEANQARSLLASTELPQFPKHLQFIPIDAVTPGLHPRD